MLITVPSNDGLCWSVFASEVIFFLFQNLFYTFERIRTNARLKECSLLFLFLFFLSLRFISVFLQSFKENTFQATPTCVLCLVTSPTFDFSGLKLYHQHHRKKVLSYFINTAEKRLLVV